MPVIAVGVAVIADAALATGAVAATAFTVTAAVGATVAAIGAVTHDKVLSYVGAGLGLVGGIGSLAAASGVLGEAASAPLWGPATAAGTGEAGASAAASGDTINTLAGATALDPVGGGAQQLGDITEAAGSPAAAAGATAAADTGLDGNFIGNPNPGSTVNIGLNNASDTASTTAAPVGQGGELTPTTAPTTPPMQQTPATEFVPPNSQFVPDANGNLIGIDPKTNMLTEPNNSGSSGFLGKLLTYGEAHPMLAFGALQAGGQFLSGMTSTLTPAQVTALNSQAAANQAAANLTARQTTNISGPKPIATLAPVTGNPGQPIIASPSGLMNSVSGVPA